MLWFCHYLIAPKIWFNIVQSTACLGFTFDSFTIECIFLWFKCLRTFSYPKHGFLRVSYLEEGRGLLSEGLWRRATAAGAFSTMEKRAFGIADDM
uniref:Uncharacterized protein n=1 Tax=Rhizophora mucronata TaxID=61149 RepID=A0A2P2L6U4_RHIMU